MDRKRIKHNEMSVTNATLLQYFVDEERKLKDLGSCNIEPLCNNRKNYFKNEAIVNSK